MLNDWRWVKVDDSEYGLKNTSNQIVAYLVCNRNRWFCRLCIDEFNLRYGVTFYGFPNTEEAIWRSTVWIYDVCNQVANSFHHIRDHLPSLYELRKNSIEGDI